MAVKKSSAEKRYKQSEVRRLRNKAVKSSVKTSAKKFVAAVHEKNAESAKTLLKDLLKELDSAKSKGILTQNAVARKKSRMTKLYNVSFSTNF